MARIVAIIKSLFARFCGDRKRRDLLPIIDDLAAFETDAERANWLLRVPDSVILRDVKAIRRVLYEARFAFGIVALEIRHCSLISVRTDYGDLKPGVREPLEIYQSGLRAIAIGHGSSIGEMH